MLKTDLIKRVSELETRLSQSNGKMDVLLDTASNLIYGKATYSYNDTSTRIHSTNQLFYELGKLIEFKEIMLEERGYDRQIKGKEGQIIFLEKRIEELEKSDKSL